MSKAIYAFSGDPITYGHINIVDRALKVFDHVVVGIGVNPDKAYTFSLAEREELARVSLNKYGRRVSVRSFQGLLVDFAYENSVQTIIRGVRNSSDFVFEHMLHDVNQSQRLGIDTHILIADQKLAHVSSSAIKELQKNQGSNILDYAPMVVKKALEGKICGQYRIGITGEIGAGKSYVAERIRLIDKSSIHNIDLDLIGHTILEKSRDQVDRDVRTDLVRVFGKKIQKKNGFIDVKALGSIIFEDALPLDEFNRLMRKPMLLKLRRSLFGLRGIVFINSALIAESGILDIVNNNVLVVEAEENVRIARLKKRGYTNTQIEKRINAQMNARRKLDCIKRSIQKHEYGECLWYVNNEIKSLKVETMALYEKIKRVLKYES